MRKSYPEISYIQPHNFTSIPPQSQSTGLSLFRLFFLEQMEVFGVFLGLYTSVSCSVGSLRSHSEVSERHLNKQKGIPPMILHSFQGPVLLVWPFRTLTPHGLFLLLPHAMCEVKSGFGSHWLTLV